MKDVYSLYLALGQLFEAMPGVWGRAIGNERILIQTEEKQMGLRIDVSAKSLDYPISIREGRISAVFLFEMNSLESFFNGESLATLKELGSLRCTGKNIAIFEASFFMDIFASTLREMLISNSTSNKVKLEEILYLH